MTLVRVVPERNSSTVTAKIENFLKTHSIISMKDDYFSKPELAGIVDKAESSFPHREIDSVQVTSVAETICDNVKTTIVNVDVRAKCIVDKVVQQITIKKEQ